MARARPAPPPCRADASDARCHFHHPHLVRFNERLYRRQTIEDEALRRGYMKSSIRAGIELNFFEALPPLPARLRSSAGRRCGDRVGLGGPRCDHVSPTLVCGMFRIGLDRSILVHSLAGSPRKGRYRAAGVPLVALATTRIEVAITQSDPLLVPSPTRGSRRTRRDFIPRLAVPPAGNANSLAVLRAHIISRTRESLSAASRKPIAARFQRLQRPNRPFDTG